MTRVVPRRPPSTVGRRQLLGGFATYPLIALVSSPPLIAACGERPPETPLAHLYGKEWVHGAYKMYAGKYGTLQESAEETSQQAYGVLAQRGVTALDALQSRDVPFYVRVAQDEQAFKVQRKVPERLTFTSDMNDADRASAEAAWNKAREHIQTDYVEVQRLDAALGELFQELRVVRNAIEEGRLEQYRICEQLMDLGGDPTKLPYQLPYQVTPQDYQEILLVLLGRLEDDRARLMALEADIVTVGMTVRSTDANSATMASSIKKVLLAVVADGEAKPPPPLFPDNEDERKKRVADAKALQAKIVASPEFNTWRADEREKKLAVFGAFLATLDAMTGLRTSAVYRTVLDIWRGEKDYLHYLRTVLTLVPHGGEVMKVVDEAIEYTEKARKIAGTVVATVKTVQSVANAAANTDASTVVAGAKAEAMAQAKGVVLNTASRFALDRVDKQLSFFKDKAEVKKVEGLLAETDLMSRLIPK